MKTLQLHKPHVLAVVGLPGAGKSFFATQFSDMFKAPYLDYGRYRSAVEDVRKADDLADNTLAQLLKTHQTLVVEGVGEKNIERRELKRFAHKNGYEVLYVWVQTDSQTAEQRAVHSKTATMSADQFETRSAGFEPLPRTDNYVVISGKHTFATQAKVVLKKLIAARPDTPISGSSPRPVSPRGRITIG